MDTTTASPIVQQTVNPVPSPAPVPNIYTNKKWTKVIPRTNLIFMVISVLFVFGLDLLILIPSLSSETNLLPFWIEMLIVFGLFVAFFLLENFLFKKRFANSKSALDPWFVSLIIVRNIVIFLNFIPFIQLLGMLIGGYVIIPYLLLYAIFVFRRFKSAELAVNSG